MNREILERAFPDALICSRKGPFGQTFSYVEGAEYIRRLNEAFDGEWSFEIVEHVVRDNEVVVIGKLTAAAITKMAFGGSSITVSREGEIISLADMKVAATDARKKAASLLGVGLHLYIPDAGVADLRRGDREPAPDRRRPDLLAADSAGAVVRDGQPVMAATVRGCRCGFGAGEDGDVHAAIVLIVVLMFARRRRRRSLPAAT